MSNLVFLPRCKHLSWYGIMKKRTKIELIEDPATMAGCCPESQFLFKVDRPPYLFLLSVPKHKESPLVSQEALRRVRHVEQLVRLRYYADQPLEEISIMPAAGFYVGQPMARFSDLNLPWEKCPSIHRIMAKRATANEIRHHFGWEIRHWHYGTTLQVIHICQELVDVLCDLAPPFDIVFIDTLKGAVIRRLIFKSRGHLGRNKLSIWKSHIGGNRLSFQEAAGAFVDAVR
jgi:hypothetical protein